MRMHAVTLVLVAFVGCSEASSSDAGSSDAGSALADGDAGSGDAGAPFAGECRGPGRYEAGRQEGYRPRPCCSGLTEVRYNHPGYNGDEKVCYTLFDVVYACVRGTCGDGICEEGEAPACGCVADCPDAAWALGGRQDGGVTPTDGGASN